jgi:DNA topoisomerase 2-associated protein PAT1
MQQQVQKAVTVAKERPKLTQYAREGALGKISFGTGKKPRQQLEIISKAAQREKERQEAEKEKSEAVESGEVSVDDIKVPKKDRSPSMSAPHKRINTYTKKDIMSILENIISNIMNVESESRTKSDVDTTELWQSLRVLEQPSSSGDDAAEVNPFIQCLNYNKALKILLRLFKFLTREQILTIVTLIMSNLENLTVIKEGSYTTYESKKVPESILKLVDTYSMTFTKVLMNAVLDFKFNEIIGLLVILIEHNNVSFVSTTKIGLSILTTLLSRAELIIGEGAISATDLSEWTSCYDELFTSLESRIAAIFPANPEDVDDGSSRENYVWQFLATLSLGGKLSHQRIIVDEVRDEIFGVMTRAKAIDNSDSANLYKKQNLLNNLNMFLVVMGLVADENEIKELQN